MEKREITSSGTGDPSGLSAFYATSSHSTHSIGISREKEKERERKEKKEMTRVKGGKWKTDRDGLCISLVCKRGTREPKLTVRLPTAVSWPATCTGGFFPRVYL